MQIWTYVRPFRYQDTDYEVKFSFSLSSYTSQLLCNNTLIDSQTHSFKYDLKVVEHQFQADEQSPKVSVSVGYFNWWNIGIDVRENDELIYSSHPDKDIYFAEKKLKKLSGSNSLVDEREEKKLRDEKWQKNKYSLFADIGIGATFFIVAKVTGDLTTAALTGVTLGLLLVILQRFVKVDLLGGLAVFGTLMLLISAILSLVFQSEYLVQLKGTMTGIIAALVFLADGVYNKGNYFGSRLERYLNSSVDHQFFVVGLGLMGLFMAGLNYAVATLLSKNAWLTYTTFLDTPLYLLMFFILIWHSGKRYQKV